MTEDTGVESCLERYRAELEAAPRVLVGLSGGVDSVVLLHLLQRMLDPQKIEALHINHGLSPNALQWQENAQQLCRKLGVRCHIEQVEVSGSGEGLEAAARNARYQVFENYLSDGGLLLLAHHGDDQVETVFYHLLRGSGPRGLAGIPERRQLSGGGLLRPLLAVSKQMLLDYAQKHELRWDDDESNTQIHFDRNYLRHQLIPPLAKRWPDYLSRVAASAWLCGESEQLAVEVADDDLLSVDVRSERAGWSVDLESLTQLSRLRAENLLRHWPGLCGLALPGKVVIAEIVRTVILARADARPQVDWLGARMTRSGQRLYLLRRGVQEGVPDNCCHTWDMKAPLRLPDGSSVFAELATGDGLVLPKGAVVEVRTRQGGERCHPAGREHSNKLKKLLQEYGLEPWWRDRLPLLFVERELAAVGDLWVCEGFQAKAGQQGVKIRWQVTCL